MQITDADALDLIICVLKLRIHNWCETPTFKLCLLRMGICTHGGTAAVTSLIISDN